MTLNRRVHFLIDPAQYAALEALARARRKATGENTTLGSLMREAIADLLAKHATVSEPRRRRSR